MKELKFVLITIVVVSGFINMILIGKVNDLENQMRNVQHQTSQINSTISSIPNQVNAQLNNALNQLKEIESWITPIHIEAESLKDDSVTVKAKWQIKDYMEDAEVLFHYQLKGEEFYQIEATMKDNGYFEATFPLDVNLEPNWEMVYQGEFTEKEVRTIEEAKKKDREANTVQYYVSMKNKDQIKSSEMNYYNLIGISNRFYGTLSVHLSSRNNNIDSIAINTMTIPLERTLESVVSKSYKGNKLLSVREFDSTNHPEENISTFHIDYQNEKQDFDRLVIEAKYSDGKVFSRELYNN